MLPENRFFMVRGEDGQEYGPVELTKLREWVQENRAGVGSEVRLDEPGATWLPWQSYPELIALLAETNAVAPVPGAPELVIAPMGRRILAFGLDLILVSILVTPILITLAIIFLPTWFEQYAVQVSQPPYTYPEPPLKGRVTGSLISNIVLVLYFTGFHAAHGRTPGKALMRLRVVNQAGQNPGIVNSFLGAFVKILSMSVLLIPFFYAFFNSRRRALHDMVADTCVVNA
jgi:uncharacterized RDD family membrane protein YckC